jgi:hypothetical protein
LTERWPWLIAFLFGLFHGLGFAGTLSEIGVPQAEVPIALLMFNVGVGKRLDLERASSPPWSTSSASLFSDRS